MKAQSRIPGFLLCVMMICAASDALAQFRGGTPGGGGFPGGGSRGSRDGSRDQRPPGEQRPAAQEDAVSVTEYRLEILHIDLRLAPEQEPAWKAFAERVGALAADMSRERGRAQATLQMKALQRIDQSVDAARNRLTALEDIAAAAKVLYGKLTPEQQSLADLRLATTVPTVSPAGAAGFPVLTERPLPK
jgi:hypothetical protein